MPASAGSRRRRRRGDLARRHGSTQTVTCRPVLSGVAPWVLRILLGEARPTGPSRRAPSSRSTSCSTTCRRCESGIDPAVAFAGTFHVAEDYPLLQAAYAEASSGRVPQILPGEVYCHSLTDPSILGAASADTR